MPLARRCIPWIALVLSCAGLHAQSFEITPFAAYTLGGDFEDRFDDDDFDRVDVEDSASYGLMMDFALNRNAAIELLYSYQDTELQLDRFFGPSFIPLEVEYYHVGFRWNWDAGVTRPFVVASLGGTGFDFGGPAGTDTRFSWSAGGGVMFMPTEHFGLRFDGRAYSTFIDEDEEIYCDAYGCFSYYDATFFFQFDVKVGLVFSF